MWNYDNVYVRGRASRYLGSWQLTEPGGTTDRLFRTYGATQFAEVEDQRQTFETGNGVPFETGRKFSQHFVPAYGTVSSAQLKLWNMNGGSSANLVVEIQAAPVCNGPPDGTPLTRGRIPNANIPTGGYGLVTVEFADLRVQAGACYHLVVYPDGNPANSLMLAYRYTPADYSTDTYTKGTAWSYKPKRNLALMYMLENFGQIAQRPPADNGSLALDEIRRRKFAFLKQLFQVADAAGNTDYDALNYAIDYLYEALGRDERLMQKFIEARGRLRHG